MFSNQPRPSAEDPAVESRTGSLTDFPLIKKASCDCFKAAVPPGLRCGRSCGHTATDKTPSGSTCMLNCLLTELDGEPFSFNGWHYIRLKRKINLTELKIVVRNQYWYMMTLLTPAIYSYFHHCSKLYRLLCFHPPTACYVHASHGYHLVWSTLVLNSKCFITLALLIGFLNDILILLSRACP